MAYWTAPLPYDGMDGLAPGDNQENYIIPVEDDDETSPAGKVWEIDDQGNRLQEGYYDESRDRASWRKERKRRKKKKHRKREQDYEKNLDPQNDKTSTLATMEEENNLHELNNSKDNTSLKEETTRVTIMKPIKTTEIQEDENEEIRRSENNISELDKSRENIESSKKSSTKELGNSEQSSKEQLVRSPSRSPNHKPGSAVSSSNDRPGSAGRSSNDRPGSAVRSSSDRPGTAGRSSSEEIHVTLGSSNEKPRDAFEFSNEELGNNRIFNDRLEGTEMPPEATNESKDDTKASTNQNDAAISVANAHTATPDDVPEGSIDSIRELLKSRVYRVDPNSCSPKLDCFSDLPDTAQRQVVKQTTDGVRGLIGIQDGCHVFEFKFNDKPWGSHCSVGVVTDKVSLQMSGYGHLLSRDVEGWAWDIPSGSLLHAGYVTDHYPTDSIVSDDSPNCIKMVVDRKNRTLSLDIGHGEEVVFDDLPTTSVVLYPAVSMVYGGCRVKFKLLESSLFHKYKPLLSPNSSDRTQTRKDDNHNTAEVNHDNACSMDSKEKETDPSQDSRLDQKDIVPDNVGEPSSNIKGVQDEPENGTETLLVNKEHQQNDVVDNNKTNISQNDQEQNRFSSPGNSPTKTQQGSPESSLINVSRNEESLNWNYTPTQQESSSDEEEVTDFKQISSCMSELPEDDQYLLHLAHGWDFINRGSLVQPYPNVPYICVPMPSLQGKVQGVRSRRGFDGRGIYTWRIQELIVYSPSVALGDMVKTRNNVIVGVASGEQRQFNFGFSLPEVGRQIWGVQFPDMCLWHGKNIKPIEIDGEENDDVQLTDGVELALNTVTHKLTFTSKGRVFAEISKVKGHKIFPFILYNSEAHWPLEINYVEGPEEYVSEVIASMKAVDPMDREDVNNKRVLMKRSSSRRDFMTEDRDNYIWGCHSPGIEIRDKTNINLVGSRGIALASYPLGGGRHRIGYMIEGSTAGLAFGLVHSSFPMDQISSGKTLTESNPCFLGNDLLSWCWDVQNRRIYHACREIGRYPIDESFEPGEVSSYTLTLDFSALGYNTAAFTAHYVDKKRSAQELGIAFVCLPSSVIPAVVMRGQQQTVKLEYLVGPWKADTKNDDSIQASKACVIL